MCVRLGDIRKTFRSKVLLSLKPTCKAGKDRGCIYGLIIDFYIFLPALPLVEFSPLSLSSHDAIVFALVVFSL
jgi:hypothetical protein